MRNSYRPFYLSHNKEYRIIQSDIILINPKNNLARTLTETFKNLIPQQVININDIHNPNYRINKALEINKVSHVYTP